MHSIRTGLKFTYVMVYSVKKDLRRLVLLQMAVLVADCIVPGCHGVVTAL